jgi:hypothetical protein
VCVKGKQVIVPFKMFPGTFNVNSGVWVWAGACAHAHVCRKTHQLTPTSYILIYCIQW